MAQNLLFLKVVFLQNNAAEVSIQGCLRLSFPYKGRHWHGCFLCEMFMELIPSVSESLIDTEDAWQRPATLQSVKGLGIFLPAIINIAAIFAFPSLLWQVEAEYLLRLFLFNCVLQCFKG